MSDIRNEGLSANGWAAVPRNFTKSLADVDKNKQAEMTVNEANPPTTDIAKKTHDFAKEQLPEKTFNHSMRVWYYGKRLSHNWTYVRCMKLDMLCPEQGVAYIITAGPADSA
jgi:hypothetical protein